MLHVGRVGPLSCRESIPQEMGQNLSLHDSCFRRPMVNGDFFGFCTTLKPLQLKAMGELSEVVHLAEGETVYSPGDVGESLYIITRGVVEVCQGNEANGSAETYLSRG